MGKLLLHAGFFLSSRTGSDESRMPMTGNGRRRGWLHEGRETEGSRALLDSTCSDEETTILGKGGNEDGGDGKKQTVDGSPGRGGENVQNW